MYQVSTLCIQNQGSSRIKQYSTVKSGTLRSLFYPLCKGFVEHEVRTLMCAHQCNVDNGTNVEPCEGKSAFFWLHVSLNQNRKLSEAAKSTSLQAGLQGFLPPVLLYSSASSWCLACLLSLVSSLWSSHGIENSSCFVASEVMIMSGLSDVLAVCSRNLWVETLKSNAQFIPHRLLDYLRNMHCCLTQNLILH